VFPNPPEAGLYIPGYMKLFAFTELLCITRVPGCDASCEIDMPGNSNQFMRSGHDTTSFPNTGGFFFTRNFKVRLFLKLNTLC